MIKRELDHKEKKNPGKLAARGHKSLKKNRYITRKKNENHETGTNSEKRKNDALLRARSKHTLSPGACEKIGSGTRCAGPAGQLPRKTM